MILVLWFLIEMFYHFNLQLWVNEQSLNTTCVLNTLFFIFEKGGVEMVDIDVEFEDFVQKNYTMLTENQKRLCEQMGIKVPFA